MRLLHCLGSALAVVLIATSACAQDVPGEKVLWPGNSPDHKTLRPGDRPERYEPPAVEVVADHQDIGFKWFVGTVPVSPMYREPVRCAGVSADAAAWIYCGHYPSPLSASPQFHLIVERECTLDIAVTDTLLAGVQDAKITGILPGVYGLIGREQAQDRNRYHVAVTADGEPAGVVELLGGLNVRLVE